MSILTNLIGTRDFCIHFIKMCGVFSNIEEICLEYSRSARQILFGARAKANMLKVTSFARLLYWYATFGRY